MKAKIYESSNHKIVRNQRGQSILEYVLLMVSIMLISFMFLRSVNTGISTYWEALGNLILDDPNQKLEFK